MPGPIIGQGVSRVTQRCSVVEVQSGLYAKGGSGYQEPRLSVRLRIGKTLLRYQEDPVRYAERITDPKLGSYRFRIGDYRVIFDLEGKDIVILRVGHRRDIYRR